MSWWRVTVFTADSARNSSEAEYVVNAPLHIIEPTLQDQAGHCHSFVASLCNASQGYPLQLWVSRHALLPDLEETATIQRYFQRRLRKIQVFALYASLLRQPGRIFVSTAGRLDVMLVNWAAAGTIPAGKVCLYFHWIRPSPGKRRFFSRIAQKQPHIRFFTPTESVAVFFRQCGITNVSVISYPVAATLPLQENMTTGFRHLVYAGAARRDKGFGFVADLVEHLAHTSVDLPVTLQVSAEHYGKQEDLVRSDIQRLEKTAYPHLNLCSETLDYQQYRMLFRGAICLQLYNQQDFADRISGVTLDAMSAGAPVVTLSGTWIARVVQRFGAGIVIDEPTPIAVLGAVRQIVAKYADYRDKALHTGRVMGAEHDAGFLFKALTDN
ncbi:MAG: hypothetical protein HXX11_01895 [Desulfuromonadales bacterium]|nr:hypothetical protein [Desulfuromonadales bacterium]